MSDSQSTSSGPGGPRKELSMEQRLLLAFGLMGVVLLLSQYIIPSPERPEPPAATQTQPAPPPPAETPAAAPPVAVPAPSEPVAAASEEVFEIETDFATVRLSNRGAVVHSWVLKQHLDQTGKPLELLNQRGVARAGYPFSIRFEDNASPDALNQALYSVSRGEDGLSVTFEYVGGSWHSRKTFEFHKDSYLAQVSSQLSDAGKPKPHLLAWRGGFGDETVTGAVSSQHSVYYDISAAKLIVQNAGDAEDGPLTAAGRYSFAGIQDSYFAAVVLPESGGSFKIQTLADMVPNAADQKEEANVGVAFGGEATNQFDVFVGPKDTHLLRSISPRLEQLVDWGWFGFLAKPLFLSLNWIHDGFVHNYGWSIVVITVLINFLLLPLKITSLKSMKKMQMLQPHIAAINQKYKGLSLRDPKKAQQNQEVMELYKKHGVNPMGGCFPMLLQIPFFIAFYKVLSVAIELRGAAWLWVDDLSRPETLPIRVLPVAMIISQFVMQKMTPTTSVDPSQQRIMMLMPLFLGFMFYGVSSGLVLYWFTGNLVGIAQQWFFNKTFHAPAPALPAPAPARKKVSRK